MAVVADKAYDSRRRCAATGGHAGHQRVCVPPKCNRLVQHAYNETASTEPGTWSRTPFCRLKDHRRLSLRLDKTETSFRAFACFAAALMNLKLKLKLCP